MKLKDRVNFYQQFAKLSKSGLPIIELCHTDYFPFLPEIKQVADALRTGDTLHSALEKIGHLSLVELAMIQAGEESGHLPQVFSRLAQRYHLKLTTKQEIRKKLSYPAVLLGFSGLALPFPQYFMGHISLLELLARSVGMWAVMFIVFGGGYYLVMNVISNPAFSRWNQWSILNVPYLGRQIVNRDYESYFDVFSLMMSAGIPISTATKDATTIIDSAYLKKIVESVADKINNGQSMSDSFSGVPYLTPEDKLLIRSADATGSFDESFMQISSQFREKNIQNLNLLATVVPKGIYFLVLIYIGFSLISNQMGYLDKLNEIVQ